MAPPGTVQSNRSPAATRRPRYRLTRRGKIVFGTVPFLLVAMVWLATTSGGSLSVEGVDSGSVLSSGESSPTISVATDVPLESLVVELNGEAVGLEPASDGRFQATLANLADGSYTLTVTAPRPFPFGALEEERDFEVDTTPPAIDVLSPDGPVPLGGEVVVRARIDDPEATVSVDGVPATPDENGIVEQAYPEIPDAAVVITAEDGFGNRAEVAVPIELALPGAPGAPPMFGVHASGWTWATPVLKDPIMDMIDSGLINTVQLDLKDEGGDIWYDTEVALAHEIGAVTVLWDLPEVVEELHAKGVRVVGRIVNFRDPRMAEHAVATGNMAWVIQNPDGSAYGQYGGFTNPFNQTVREYNIALAEEAARLGVDDIMFDYVRRPDTLNPLVYPGQEGSPSDAIISFLEDGYDRVHASGARLGAAVFGIAATRPDEVAQDIPRMAEVIDYIAPMVYPSHWGPGEYGVADPNAQPYDITYRSLLDFVEMTEGTRSHVVAWLQDFSLGVEYGAAEVRAQIQASRDAGVHNILLWDAATTYTRAALDPLDG